MTATEDRPLWAITNAALALESRTGAADGDSAVASRPAPSTSRVDGIYRRGALLYRKAGWAGVLPLPPTAKFPPPKGFTGYDGAWPTDGQIAQWVSNRPAEANLTLRVNYGIIGIDVDAYGTKTGGRALQNAESSWGQLPPTYRSTARPDDPVSGIRIFKVPEGVLFRDRIAFPDLGVGDTRSSSRTTGSSSAGPRSIPAPVSSIGGSVRTAYSCPRAMCHRSLICPSCPKSGSNGSAEPQYAMKCSMARLRTGLELNGTGSTRACTSS